MALDLLVDVVGDRRVMIDHLHSDGYIISDATNADDSAIEEHKAALETLEEIGI